MFMQVIPSIVHIAPFDALKGTSIYYVYTGSKQAIINELEITKASNNEIVYKFEYSSFEKVHHVPPALLANGILYRARIRVKFEDGTFSPYSTHMGFQTLKTPVVDISNIDGQGYVYNQDVTFIATYSQDNGEKVKTYKFILYDENGDLIRHYPVRYPMQEGSLTELAKGLEKGKGYFVECVIETINGMSYSHKEKFIPMYIVPSVNGVISLRSDEDDGFVRITSNLSQILGTQVKADVNDDYHSDNYDYIDDDIIVIPKDKTLLFKGLNMNKASDFVMKVWCRNIPYNTKFIELQPENGIGIKIEFWRYKDRVVVVKRNGKVVSRYRSNIYNIPKDVDFMIYAKAIEHRIDVSIQIV